MANPTLFDRIVSGKPLASVRFDPNPTSGTPGTLATSGTLSHNGKNYIRTTTSAAVTAIVLQAGYADGQILFIENVSDNSITFDVAATSNVRDGASSIIAGRSVRTLIWNAVNSTWTMEAGSAGGILNVVGAAPAAVATSPGTAGTADVVTGAVGGATTIATTGTGGAGSAVTLTGGGGGLAASAVTAGTGGAGGAVGLVGGAGALSAVTGSGTGTGGAGGAAALTGGAGGAVTTNTGTKTGGAGGASVVTGGVGGAASAGAGTDTGGIGGAAALVAGAGGNGGDTGGAGGAVQLTAGNAGTGGNANGGNIVLTFGTKTGSGIDGVLEIANQVAFLAQSSGASTNPTFPAGWSNGTPKWLKCLDTVAGKTCLIPVFVSS